MFCGLASIGSQCTITTYTFICTCLNCFSRWDIVSSKLPSVRWVNSSDSPSFFCIDTHRRRYVSCFRADSNWIFLYSTFPLFCSSSLTFSFNSAGIFLASLGSTKICTSKPAGVSNSNLPCGSV